MSVNSILKEQLALERRYHLLQAAAILRAATWIPADADPNGLGGFELDAAESVERAEDMLEEIEKRDAERRQT